MVTRLQAPPYDALAPHLPKIGGADSDTARAVRAILDDVRAGGDAAVREHTRRLDGVDLPPGDWEVPAARWQQALERIPRPLRGALELAVQRVRDYHANQADEGFLERDADGTEIGMRVVPLDRVGLYVPGGKAAYPSTVIMNAVPAVVAGVAEIVMVTPPTDAGAAPDVVLAAARLAGVDRVFRIGGAQAIAALAYGTPTIPRVDKIVGPGNRFVTEAKRQVAGFVGIDGLAGPSELAIVADGDVDPRIAALDLIAQAEHDPEARTFFLTPDAALAEKVGASLEHEVEQAGRRDIVDLALRHTKLVLVRDLDHAAAAVNDIAAEHVLLLVDDPRALLPKVRNAGAIFLGSWSAVSFGDYGIASNHVLPTAGTARFSSGLRAADYVTVSSVIQMSPEAALGFSAGASALARAEGLVGHAKAMDARAVEAGR